MDFCDLDDPWGNVARAREVLDFASMSLCWMQAYENETISSKQCSGLMWILTACAETLKKAEEEAEENKCGFALVCEKKRVSSMTSAAS